jgi:hypothetical protein
MAARGPAKTPRELETEAQNKKRDAEWKRRTGYKHKPGAGRPPKEKPQGT